MTYHTCNDIYLALKSMQLVHLNPDLEVFYIVPSSWAFRAGRDVAAMRYVCIPAEIATLLV